MSKITRGPWANNDPPIDPTILKEPYRSMVLKDGPAALKGLHSVKIARGSDIAPVPIPWQWPGHVAAGKLHILAGAKGALKTTIAIDLAAKITSGPEKMISTTRCCPVS
jgi:hypothetical protein